MAIPHKVYALLPFDDPVDATLNAAGYITGIALRLEWATLNPAEDQYDFSLLDSHVSASLAAGKKLTVYVGHVPDWVLAQSRQFTFIDPGGATAGSTLAMPVPWDKTFLRLWYKFIAALGVKYINETTITAWRGSSDMLTAGWGMGDGIDIHGKPWSKYGWKETGGLRFWAKQHTMLEALKASVNAWLTALPNHWHFGSQGTFLFEPDNTGRQALYAVKAYTDFLVKTGKGGPWRENLTGCITESFPATSPSQYEIPSIHFGLTGFQMLWNVQDLGAAKRMNKCGLTPNDKGTVMTAAINKGIDFGGKYLEIYAVDVKDADSALRAAITSANTSL